MLTVGVLTVVAGAFLIWWEGRPGRHGHEERLLAALERLVAALERVYGDARLLTAGAPSAEAPSAAGAPAPTFVDEVEAMAERGADVDAIARRKGRTPGEVELALGIVRLRRERRPG